MIIGLWLFFQQENEPQPVIETPNPISGGIYTEALVGEFLRLNPFLDIYNQPDQDVDSLLFNSLVKFKADGMPEPDLAETWGISANGTVYTFSLRDEIYWHDGVKFSSEDVLFTVDLLKSGNALIPEDRQKFWNEVEVVSLSKNLVEFSLPEAFSPFPDYMSFEILPVHLLGGLSLDELIDHPFNLAPVGTGPYKFGKVLVNDGKISGVVLEANDNYFEGSPFLEEIVFMYYENDQLAWEAYQAGVVDGIAKVEADILNNALAEPDLNLYSARSPQLSMIFLNLDNPKVSFFQDAHFRIALLKAIDRQRIIDTVYFGQAIPAHGPIMPGSWAYYDAIEHIEYNLAEAQSMLAGVGITPDDENASLVTEEGQVVSFELLIPDTEKHLKIGEMIAYDWEKLGMTVTLNIKPYNDVIAQLQSREYETALVDIDYSGTPDPDPYPFWGSAQAQGGQNYSQWNNRAASELIEQARINLDYGARSRLYRNFQVVFQEELPSLPLFYPVYNYAVEAKINGISIGPFFDYSDRFNTIQSWYILAKKTTNQEQSTSTPAEN